MQTLGEHKSYMFTLKLDPIKSNYIGVDILARKYRGEPQKSWVRNFGVGGQEPAKRFTHTQNAVLVCGASSDLRSGVGVGFWHGRQGC